MSPDLKASSESVLHCVISERRKKWAELLAWSALAARDKVDADHWINFTLVVHAILSRRPISDIPQVLIPIEGAHQNEVIAPAVTE